MKLTLEQVRSAARGVARVEEIDGKITFFRFSAAQDAFYSRRDADFHRKSHATSGVILEFDTDSRNLDGVRMYHNPDLLDDLFDVDAVFDKARPTPVPR